MAHRGAVRSRHLHTAGHSRAHNASVAALCLRLYRWISIAQLMLSSLCGGVLCNIDTALVALELSHSAELILLYTLLTTEHAGRWIK